jgi:DNA repair protein RadC
VREIFRPAIKANTASIIVAHNHLSDWAKPSAEEIQWTREVAQAGKLLDIQILDHLIIGRQDYVSLNERRTGFKGDD